MTRARHDLVIPHARILVADDDLALLEAVCESLEQLGAEVVGARNGAELIEQIGEEGPFDLVVTDVAMPWMTGLQVMHSARTAGLATPVVIMTALKEERIDAQVRTLGSDVMLLRKPFALEDLDAVVTTLLLRREAARELMNGTRGNGK
jgi:DNA-binding response OmpR family regulator